MIPTQTRFRDLRVETPDESELARTFAELVRRARSADDEGSRLALVDDWEQERRRVLTWGALARIRFQQDTRDAAADRERAHAERFATLLAGHEVELKRLLLEDAATWERLLGAQAVALWRADVAAFDPRIADAQNAEQELCARYAALTGGAQIELDGRERTLSELLGRLVDPDRERRRAAELARWGWFAANREELDGLFDELVRTRHGMARALGHDDFVALGYERKRRVDYGRADVERFRERVREQLVPLCERIARRQADALGLARLRTWDERVFQPGTPPTPLGDGSWMIERAGDLFDALSPRLSEFWGVMRERELLDLEGRPGKAFGGFCSYLHEFGVPFIFANFNGTRGDARVFTHEMGHAFQRWSSAGMRLADYTGCTSESAEIHSMSLEFLAWPHMELFFGGAAEDFRRTHLMEQLMFLPYGVAIDHFQHEVYANPDASPAERFALWRDLERTYMPWRDHGDLPHVSEGGAWQMQRHVYLYPFYYVDYVLAGVCALQFWERSQRDFAGALAEYEALCARGGSLPFRKLTASAGLVSPFEDGCLERVVDAARAHLEL